MFSGSYPPEDVTFLLKPVRLESTDVAAKEKLIQSGHRHYSEMITREQPPSPRYLQAFFAAVEQEQNRFARHLWALARQISKARHGSITLVSLARAGTPVGVILTRVLRTIFWREVNHYSVSIIRDRGIDAVALQFILARHVPASVVFVDGWTGKGVIADELKRAITSFNQENHATLDSGLFVVADLCGAAAVAVSTEDYLIPSSLLGATVSGLVSRSILNSGVIGPGDFHGCLFYDEYRDFDLSVWFADRLFKQIRLLAKTPGAEATLLPTAEDLAKQRQKNQEFLTNITKRFGTRNLHYIKPGIGETTRVLLRRVPDRLLLRNPSAREVAHLLLLAEEKNVPVETDPELPYLAAALIKELD